MIVQLQKYKENLSIIANNKQLIVILILGIFSGLPLALTASSLTAFLKDIEINKATIGIFALVATPYSLKFLWATMLDNLKLPILYKILGRRKSWIIFSQILLVMSLSAIYFVNISNIVLIGIIAFLISTFSATQDIAIDAYRIETLKKEDQAFGSACAVFGYRLGMLLSSAGALFLQDYISKTNDIVISWKLTYLIMASIMLLGAIFTIIIKKAPEINYTINKIKNLSKTIIIASIILITYFAIYIYSDILFNKKEYLTIYILTSIYLLLSSFALIGLIVAILSRTSIQDSTLKPFLEFTKGKPWFSLLLFIVLYKICDALLGSMTTPFIKEIGFSNSDIALYVKSYGFISSIIGSFIGGYIVYKYGLYKSLIICGLIQTLSNLTFIWQSYAGLDPFVLSIVISVENLSSSMGATALIAFLSLLCNIKYTATQYALLSSFAVVGRTFLASGVFFIDNIFFPNSSFIDVIGWNNFFIITTISAIPAFILLFYLSNYIKNNIDNKNNTTIESFNNN